MPDIELWSADKADAYFSEFIRIRDGRCMHPRCRRKYDRNWKGMQNSHFFGRGEWVTRFDPDNCDTAHRGCHLFNWENKKNTEYRDYMIRKLGKAKFNAMEKKVMATKKVGAPKIDRHQIIRDCMEFLKSVGFVDENYKKVKNYYFYGNNQGQQIHRE